MDYRQVYSFDRDGYFRAIVNQNADEITGVYPQLFFATDIAPPAYNKELELLRFLKGAWILEDLKERGVFYLKADAAEALEIVKKDISLYTKIEPLQKYDDGTAQAFSDVLLVWEYVIKGLELMRQAKITQLQHDFNASKKITLQNGKTLVIKHDTEERPYFLKMLEECSTLSGADGAAFIYEQKTDEGVVALRILPEIATYIFKDMFIVILDNKMKTKVNSRIHNKTTVYNFAYERIHSVSTIKQLNAIHWNFSHPAGLIIDVNDKANKMLVDSSVSDYAKAAINASKDPISGEIHIVKTLAELAANS